MIWIIDAELSQQIRECAVLQVALAQIGARIDCHDSHLPHIASYGVFVNTVPFAIHDGGNLSVAQERFLGVQLVNPVLEAYFLRRWRDRLVIQAAAV